MDRDSEREAGKYRGPFIAEPFQDHLWSLGAQWLSGRVLDLRPRGRSLVLVQLRKTCPYIAEGT